MLECSTGILNSSLSTKLASDIPSGDPCAMYRNPIEDKHNIDQIEDSDVEDNGVQVCDICGDCGQENLLATCCKCNDGAEHIYCMREILDRVPDGDWMCEECKYMELVTNEKSQKIRRVDESERKNPNGQESSSTINSCSIEEQRTRGYMRTPGKGLGDYADCKVSSIDKEPMVKLEDQVVVLPRQILMREHISFALMEGVTRSDVRCTLQQSSSQHYISPKTSWSSTPRVDKKPASSCESSPLTTITNHHELQPVQKDEKSAAVLRPSSLSFQKKANLSSSLGEFGGPTSHDHSTLGVFSTFGTEYTELKSKQANPKEEDISFSIVSETPPLSQGLSNGLSHSRDFASSGVGMEEYSGNHFQPSSVKSLKDEGDILKAAIEAALLRKPGLCQKRKALCRPDSSFISAVAYGTASCQDHISISIGKKSPSFVAEWPERQTVSQHSSDIVYKQETLSTANLIHFVPAKGLYSGGGGAIPIVTLDEKSSLRETLSNIQVEMPVFLRTLIIPTHEYIWQGSFEICRRGRISDSWDGIQAHLSRRASPKVMEAVNKFKNRIILYEVPRLSTWPLQFQEHGVTEDNVALFFFAKDVESYDKIYKLLLENMMKNDLALKGNFNGVELLIFPSNQLPDNSQRWNTLFFLWGVFRGEKQSCSQHIPEPLEQFISSQDMPPAILSLPPNRCSLRPITGHLLVSQQAAPAPDVLNAAELCSLLSSRTLNGDCSVKNSPSGHPDDGHFSSPEVAVLSDNAKQCQGLSTMSLEGGGMSSSCKLPQQAESSTIVVEGEHIISVLVQLIE